jgi:hypothetical protein
MRLPILVYGVLYVVAEMVAHSLATVGWERVTPLDVAAALVDALLAIVVAIAAVVAHDLARRRWLLALRAWRCRGHGQDGAGWNGEPWETIEVDSWRAGEEPAALPWGPGPGGPGASGTYGRPVPSGRRFPEEPGRLL